MAPLSFLTLLVAAHGSVAASPTVWAAGLGLLGACALLPARVTRPGTSTRIGAAVLLFGAWMALTNLLVNPSYSAAAPFHAAFLLGGFALGWRAGEGGAPQLFRAALACGVAFAAWALWQRTQGVMRPSALFETPATLSAFCNLALVGGLALVLAGARHPVLLVALAAIAAALAVSASRGGWLGLAAGVALASFLLRRAGALSPRHNLAALAVVAGGAAVLAFAATAIGDAGRAPSGAPVLSVLGPDAVRSSVARLELYELALRSVSPSLLPAGYGYLGFYYLLEASRHAIASYENGISYFVHNDYLQTLLELGVPGFAALVFIVAWPLAALLRAAPRSGETGIAQIAAACAAFSMTVHALVDYPFYTPVCLLAFGAALGMIASLRGPALASPPLGAPRAALGFTTKAVAIAVAAVLLGAPLAAELAGRRAHEHWQQGATEAAAYWFEVSRRLSRRDWRHHWQAGQFWLVQALQNGNAEAARRADGAFADGVRANPRDVRNLLGRIATQRQLAGVLPAPVDATTLRAWRERALEIAPNDPAVRRLRAAELP